MLAATLFLVGLPDRSATAEQIVVFSATVFQSPFPSGDLAVNGTIAGRFTYDPLAVPFQSGPNFAKYQLLSESITSGAATFTVGSGEIVVAHNSSIELPDGTSHNQSDIYIVDGFSLFVPSIQSLNAVFARLVLVDTDASIYTTDAFPVELPDAGLFEVKQFALLFLDESFQRSDLIARIDSISVVPEPGSLSLTGLAGLLVMWFARRNRRRSIAELAA